MIFKNLYGNTYRNDFTPFSKALAHVIKRLGACEVRLRSGADIQVELVFDDTGACWFKGINTIGRWLLDGTSVNGDPSLNFASFDLPDEVVPAIGSKWLHKKGNTYVVVAITNEHSTRPEEFPISVVYTSVDNKVWSRPLYAWHESMSPTHSS